jgi:hypothetical protein
MKPTVAEFLASLTTLGLTVRRRSRHAWHDLLEARRRRRRQMQGRATAVVVGAASFVLLLAIDAAAGGATGGPLFGRQVAAGRHVGVAAHGAPEGWVAGIRATAPIRPAEPVTTTTAASAPPLEAAAPDPPPPPPAATTPRPGALPVGKGMWIWLPEVTEGGNAAAIVARAKAVGLTHLYVQTGSSWKGFIGGPFLDALLPLAHAQGLRVYGWDFPNFVDANADVIRALTAIGHTTPDGHRIDGFSADVETPAEGTQLSGVFAAAYGSAIRNVVGAGYPLIATVPRPSAKRVVDFPYAEVVASFDAIAPMVYWLNRQPDSDIAESLPWLAQFGKPLLPVGQAYDGAPEGGRPGPPPADEIIRFMAAAEQYGAQSVSFWSWQAASQEIWDTIAQTPQFSVPVGDVAAMTGSQVRALQTSLAALGHAVPLNGVWDMTSWLALLRVQLERGLPATGAVDDPTRAILLGPVPRG